MEKVEMIIKWDGVLNESAPEKIEVLNLKAK
jgi:hypothetical protein